VRSKEEVPESLNREGKYVEKGITYSVINAVKDKREGRIY
jgi:hypothetical protein